jgi:hypothetical protein
MQGQYLRTYSTRVDFLRQGIGIDLHSLPTAVLPDYYEANEAAVADVLVPFGLRPRSVYAVRRGSKAVASALTAALPPDLLRSDPSGLIFEALSKEPVFLTEQSPARGRSASALLREGGIAGAAATIAGSQLASTFGGGTLGFIAVPAGLVLIAVVEYVANPVLRVLGRRLEVKLSPRLKDPPVPPPAASEEP